jgi:tetratricopeptide (TPR) repeat protein
VSLLMDALRKAEQQKQGLAVQNRPDPVVASSALELEPILSLATPSTAAASPTPQPPSKSGGNQLPELPTRLEDLDEQFMAHAAKTPFKPSPTIAPPPPEPMAKPRESAPDTSPEAARKLFEAKQPAPGNNRNFAIAVGAVTVIAAIGIGGYFWWQLQPKGALVSTVATAATGVPLSPSATPASAAPIVAAQPPVAVPPAPTFSGSAIVPAASAPLAAPPATSRNYDADENAGLPSPKRAETRTVQASPAAQAQSPVRLSMGQQKINPLLDQAYQAFNRGEIDLAVANWQKVLASDPRNADALHGLAAVAQQRKQTGEAADYYLRALEADPKDALALSGLVSLRTPADTQSTESRLKTLLAEQPDSPYLNFALGNLYARSTRWAEAQQAYFKSHSADPGNPDYLFNLAVSLDQLHQPNLAIQYYKQALSAVTQQPVGFDAAQVSARLKILQAGQ